LRYVIFSDIHSNIEAFEKLLSLKKINNIDKYLFLGDLVGYGPNPDEVITQFRKLPNMNFVRGNHDKVHAPEPNSRQRLDFVDDVDRSGEGAVLTRIACARSALLQLGAETGAGRACDALPTVVIVGAPNAGKSTLFNALLGEDRALVTELAGTTRDAVAEVFEVEGDRVRLVDTAGLRETTEMLERLGVEAAGRAAAGADLLLVAREAGGEAPSPGALPEGVPVLALATKADLPGKSRDGEVRVSARTGEGMTALRREIGVRLAAFQGVGVFGALPRQREALLRAAAALDGIGPDVPAEIAAGAVRAGLHALGEITGETATEELLDRIFSTFCVGK